MKLLVSTPLLLLNSHLLLFKINYCSLNANRIKCQKGIGGTSYFNEFLNLLWGFGFPSPPSLKNLNTKNFFPVSKLAIGQSKRTTDFQDFGENMTQLLQA